MKVTRLYIINYDDDEAIMRVAYELLRSGNKLVRIACGGEVVESGCVVEELFTMCIEELEFIVCSNFDSVIDDLYFALYNVDYDVDMKFVLEVENGYVYLTPKDVKRIVYDEEEEYGKEE